MTRSIELDPNSHNSIKMDRESVLKEALYKNANDTERWQLYKSENETTIKNLDMFAQNLSVDIMVPIGSKALMPGELIHTNELLVGHYQGYFSTCSAHKAKEICRHRLRQAEEHLKKLDTETDLWQNKLDTPYLEGAVPSGEEIEIVEDYNEEEHQQWLEEHKKRMRKEKLEERAQREAEAKNEVEVELKLEEREMLEELGLEPDDLNEATLGKLLGNVATNPSEAQQVEKEERNDCDKKEMSDEQAFDILAKLEAQEENETVEMDTEVDQSLKSTDEMLRNLMSGQVEVTSSKMRIGRSEKEEPAPILLDDDNESEEEPNSDDEDDPEEVQTIRQLLERMPREERLDFLRGQLQILRAKMRKIQNENSMNNELTHLMDVVVCLEDDLQGLVYEQQLLIDSDEESSVEEPEPEIAVAIAEPAVNKKRRISFALAEEKLEFRQNETVAEMLPKAKQQSREVIELNAEFKHLQTPIAKEQPKVVQLASPDILQKVERSLEFVKENQSVQDFDLVNQILEASTGRINTLHIGFKHSTAQPAVEVPMEDDSSPGTPADLFAIYEKEQAKASQDLSIYVNSFEGEAEVKVPILKEEARQAAYDDPRVQFFKTQQEEQTKSILRNKSAVEREPHISSENKKKRGKKQKQKPRTLDDELADMSAYRKVMQDLVEKEEPTAPEPLPEGKFIDAHTPKKRVSRFKEQRAMLNRT